MPIDNVFRKVSLLGALAVCACSGSSTEPEPNLSRGRIAARQAEASRLDGETQSASDGPSIRDASASTCEIPPDCERVPLPGASLEPCCTDAIACGFEMKGGLPGQAETVASAVNLRDGETCAPRDRFFIEHPGNEDMRVETDSGEEILLTTGCNTASILSISFAGCCMPNNRCGVSTYGIWDTLAVIAPGAAFAQLECVASKVLNTQIENSLWRGLRFLPDTDKPCDYAALAADLPPIE